MRSCCICCSVICLEIQQCEDDTGPWQQAKLCIILMTTVLLHMYVCTHTQFLDIWIASGFLYYEYCYRKIFMYNFTFKRIRLQIQLKYVTLINMVFKFSNTEFPKDPRNETAELPH